MLEAEGHMRVPILVTLAAVGLLAACSEQLSPDPNQPAERVSAAKIKGRCPSGYGSWATGVNSAGKIVGAVDREDDIFACLWDDKTGAGIQLGPMDWASAINASGQVVGWTVGEYGSVNRALLWDNGVLTELGTLPGKESSYPLAINNAGQVVGYSAKVFDESPRAFLWQKGVMTDLGTLPGKQGSAATGINEAGQVVGWSGAHAFLWDKGRMVDLGANSSAAGINAAGQVVGTAQGHATIWYRGTKTDLGPGSASAINNAGVAVGQSGRDAVFWRNGIMTRLSVPYEEDDYYSADAISESGVVVGTYYYPAKESRYTWTIK
jgi:probable HAF family extracellular repeat protein